MPDSPRERSSRPAVVDTAPAPVATPSAPATRGSRRAASAWLLLVWRWIAPVGRPRTRGPLGHGRRRGCLAVAVLLLHLFVPTVVGMGDQGDGQRLMCAFGVANTAPYDYAREHAVRLHAVGTAPLGGRGVRCRRVRRTLRVVPDAARVAGRRADAAVRLGRRHRHPRRRHRLRARVRGARRALRAFLPGRALFRLIAAALVVAVVGDGVFARFFVSPYSEAACFLGVLAMVVCLLAMRRRGDPTWLGMLLFSLATVFTITAKTQMVALLPAAALALLWRPLRARRGRGDPVAQARRRRGDPDPRAGRPRPRGRVVPRLLGASLVVALAGVAVGYAAIQPRHFTLLNTYNAVFVEMLPHSPDPEGDLRWFGLPADWASSSGTTVVSENAAVHRPDFPRFTEEVSQGRIALFYATHPARLVGMADRGLEAMTQPVLGYVGAYPPDVGAEPWQQEHRFPVVVVVSALLGTVPSAIVLLQIVALALGLASRSGGGSSATVPRPSGRRSSSPRSRPGRSSGP